MLRIMKERIRDTRLLRNREKKRRFLFSLILLNIQTWVLKTATTKIKNDVETDTSLSHTHSLPLSLTLPLSLSFPLSLSLSLSLSSFEPEGLKFCQRIRCDLLHRIVKFFCVSYLVEINWFEERERGIKWVCVNVWWKFVCVCVCVMEVSWEIEYNGLNVFVS